MAGEDEGVDEKFVKKMANEALKALAKGSDTPAGKAAMKELKLNPETALAAEALEKLKDRGKKAEREAEEAADRAESKARKAEEKENETEEAARDAKADKEVGKLRSKLSSAVPGGSGNQGGGFSMSLWIVFFAGLLFHLILESPIGFNFSVSTPITITRFIFYSILALILMLSTRDPRGWALMVAEVAVPIILVYTDNLIPQAMTNAFLFLWWTAPLFPIYISYQHTDTKRFFTLWAWFWLIIVFILLISNLTLLPFIPDVYGQLDLWGATKDFTGMIWDATKGLWVALLTGFGKIPDTVDRGLNYATGGYYAGIVEDQKGEKVGLYLEKVRFSNQQYYVGDDVYMWADLTGKSFRDAITLTTACYTNTGINGETEPDFFHIYQQGSESVQCKLSEVPEGSHMVHFTAGFNYDTWAYVTYTFVKQELLLNLLRNDQDVNRELDVDRILKPIYTPGPVRLGMSSNVLQPIGVDEEHGINTVFGATLDNDWSDGEISRVREFLIYVPQEFELHSCDVPITEDRIPDPECREYPDRCANEMVVYRFALGEEGPIRSFESVTCRLRLLGSVSDLVPLGAQKVQKTFVVKAEYDYTLNERRSVGVDQYVR